MWVSQLILGLIGLCGGLAVAAGTITLIIELGIIPRFAGITHTADKILLYEDMTLLGAVFGNTFFLYQYSLPFGNILLPILGLFSGIYLGAWIIALTEVLNVFPVLFRRLGIEKGISLIIISIAAGKIAGALIHFMNGW